MGEVKLTPPIDAETIERRLHLWFFRDLTADQRLGLFRLCGFPIVDMGTHTVQRMALRGLTAALQQQGTDEVNNGQ